MKFLHDFFLLEKQLIWMRAVTNISSFSNVKMPQTRFCTLLHEPSFTKKLNLLSSSNFKSLFFVNQVNFNAFESSLTYIAFKDIFYYV